MASEKYIFPFVDSRYSENVNRSQQSAKLIQLKPTITCPCLVVGIIVNNPTLLLYFVKISYLAPTPARMPKL